MKYHRSNYFWLTSVGIKDVYHKTQLLFLFFTLIPLAFGRPGIMTKGGIVHMNTLRGCRNGETWEAMDQGLHMLWPYEWVTSQKYTDRTRLWEGRQSTRDITVSSCGCHKWEGKREGKGTRWQWPIMSWLAHWERKVPSRRQMGKLVRQGWSLSGFGAYPGTS